MDLSSSLLKKFLFEFFTSSEEKDSLFYNTQVKDVLGYFPDCSLFVYNSKNIVHWCLMYEFLKNIQESTAVQEGSFDKRYEDSLKQFETNLDSITFCIAGSIKSLKNDIYQEYTSNPNQMYVYLDKKEKTQIIYAYINVNLITFEIDYKKRNLSKDNEKMGKDIKDYNNFEYQLAAANGGVGSKKDQTELPWNLLRLFCFQFLMYNGKENLLFKDFVGKNINEIQKSFLDGGNELLEHKLLRGKAHYLSKKYGQNEFSNDPLFYLKYGYVFCNGQFMDNNSLPNPFMIIKNKIKEYVNTNATLSWKNEEIKCQSDFEIFLYDDSEPIQRIWMEVFLKECEQEAEDIERSCNISNDELKSHFIICIKDKIKGCIASVCTFYFYDFIEYSIKNEVNMDPPFFKKNELKTLTITDQPKVIYLAALHTLLRYEGTKLLDLLKFGNDYKNYTINDKKTPGFATLLTFVLTRVAFILKNNYMDVVGIFTKAANPATGSIVTKFGYKDIIEARKNKTHDNIKSEHYIKKTIEIGKKTNQNLEIFNFITNFRYKALLNNIQELLEECSDDQPTEDSHDQTTEDKFNQIIDRYNMLFDQQNEIKSNLVINKEIINRMIKLNRILYFEKSKLEKAHNEIEEIHSIIPFLIILIKNNYGLIDDDDDDEIKPFYFVNFRNNNNLIKKIIPTLNEYEKYFEENCNLKYQKSFKTNTKISIGSKNNDGNYYCKTCKNKANFCERHKGLYFCTKFCQNIFYQ